MFYYLIDLALVIFEVFCCHMFFETFGKVQDKKRKKVFVVLLVCCDYGYLFLWVFEQYFILKQVAVILTTAILMGLYYEFGKKKSLLLATLYQGLLLVVDYLAYAAKNTLFSSDDVIRQEYEMEGMLLVALAKILLFVCILVIKKVFRESSLWKLTDAEWIRFLFFPIFTIIAIAAMIMNFKYVANEAQANVLFCIAFGLSGMNAFVFYLFKDILKRESQLHEQAILQTEIKNKSEMYHSLAENYETQKKRTHEFKNQLTCIQSLLNGRDYDELSRYVENVSGRLENDHVAINTNHVIVNAILNSKYREALEKDIIFVPKINDLHDLPMEDDDVIVILSNLLNNATEACEKCIDRKILKIKFVKEESQVVLAVRNTYDGTIVKREGEFQTTKEYEKQEHGIGIKNITNLVEKYGGTYRIKYDKKEFFFSIIIPID